MPPKYVYLIYLFILFPFLSFSQKKNEPTENDIKLAKSLKETFPKASVVLQKSEDIITFNLNNKKNKVVVNKKSKESMINIDPMTKIKRYSFYDNESTISTFEIKNKNNKNIFYSIYDKAYITNDLFHNDTRVKFANIKFPLLGYIYKTEISKDYHDIKYFTSLYFNEDYPIINRTIKFEVPDWLEIELKEINFDGYSIKKNVSTDSKKELKIYTYTLENTHAFHKENNAPGPSYIYPHILILAKSFTYKGEKQSIFNSTQDLYNWYRSLVNSLKNENSQIKELVRTLTENAKNDEEKIKNIYYWVQDNIRYIAFEDGIAGFKPDEASNVFDKKYGDCKGMANLTKQMLIEAGFDARLSWIGTKRIAYNYSTPNLSVDNHMICSLINDEEIIFLDGTEKFNAFGEYANRIQGKQVLIENGNDFIIETVPEITADFNKETIKYSLALENETLKGEGYKNFNGESRSSLLYYFDNLRSDKKDEFLEYYLNNGNTNIKVSNIETSNLSDREQNLNIKYDISIKNTVSYFDNEVYIDLDFDKELENFLFEKRKTDYVFDFKRHIESSTILKVPSNFTILKVPDNISVSNNEYTLSVNFTKANNIITYKKTFKFNKGKIETEDFEEWNDFIRKLKNLYNEQIILRKL